MLSRLNVSILLSFFSVLMYGLNGNSILSWPSLDMASGIKEWFEPGSIVNDLYTDCFTNSNPRYFFMLILAPFKFFGFNWYESIQIVTLINVALLPALYFFVLTSFVNNALSRVIVFFCLLLLTLKPELFMVSSIGWWSSYNVHFHPSVFAISFLLLGTSFLSSKNSQIRFVGWLLISFSAFIHPLFSFYGSCFLFILHLKTNIKRGFILVLLVAMSCVIFSLITDGTGISAQDYYDYFTWHFPEHYIPSMFVSPWPWSHWITPFFINMIVLFACFVHSLIKRDKLILISFFFVFSYGLSLLLQYGLVELNHNIKLVLLVAPIRYSSFGLFISLMMVCFKIESLNVKFNNNNWLFFGGNNKLVTLSLFSFALILVFFNFKYYLNDPMKLMNADEAEVIDWVVNNTQVGSVIISPPNGLLKATIPLFTGRGTYYGNGVPFSASCIKSNYQRYVHIYGPISSKFGRQGAKDYYEKMDAHDFSTLVDVASYVITQYPLDGKNTIKINESYYILRL